MRIMPAATAMTRAIDSAIQRSIDRGELTAWMWIRQHQYDRLWNELSRVGYAVTAHTDEDDPAGLWLALDMTGLEAPPVRDSYDRP